MSPAAENNPRVGVGVFVLNDHEQFIVGRRKGSHGAGTWALPGGHLEYGESFETCATRETLEETGLLTTNVRFLTATNNVMKNDNAHYVTIFMTAKVSGEKIEPELLEPEKCECWEWVTWEQLRSWAEKQRETQREGRGDTRMLFLPLLDLFEHQPQMNLAHNA